MNSLLRLNKSNLAKEINNLPEIKIPDSPRVLEYLLAIERYHFGGRPKGWCQWCNHRVNTPEDPCPNLAKARAMTSRETKITVALILAGDGNDG